jgi:toxin FitB
MSRLLDACVLSELLRSGPNASLLRWFEQQDEDTLYLSVLTLGDLERGIGKLPASRKKNRLAQWVREDLARRFEGRILSIHAQTAQRWGAIVGASERKGRRLPAIDSLIAATALIHGLMPSRAMSPTSNAAASSATIPGPWLPATDSAIAQDGDRENPRLCCGAQPSACSAIHAFAMKVSAPF